MKLIDADALYETLCNVWDRLDSEDFEKAVFEIIQKAQDAQPEPHWIPCSERLPVEGNNVLLSDDLNVTIGRLIHYTDTGYKWEVDHWDYDLEVWQAWQPLPEPYKEGES